ncbi:hypothetical protein VTI74DRAFT_8505 [Chaetomium olivicolor]
MEETLLAGYRRGVKRKKERVGSRRRRCLGDRVPPQISNLKRRERGCAGRGGGTCWKALKRGRGVGKSGYKCGWSPRIRASRLISTGEQEHKDRNERKNQLRTTCQSEPVYRGSPAQGQRAATARRSPAVNAPVRTIFFLFFPRRPLSVVPFGGTGLQGTQLPKEGQQSCCSEKASS